MTSTRQVEIHVRARSLPDALTVAMRQLINANLRSAAASDRSQTASIQAEAASARQLLPLLTQSLAGLLDDFEASPVEVSIHGLRWLPDAVRVWGTVTLTTGNYANPLDIEWIGPPEVDETDGGWYIKGQARVAFRP